jgi:beta-lactam-binding protein with PASTA domain
MRTRAIVVLIGLVAVSSCSPSSSTPTRASSPIAASSSISGPLMIRVPNVRGLSPAEAKKALQAAVRASGPGAELTIVTHLTFSSRPPNMVLGIEPWTSRRVPSGARVIVEVAKPIPRVPDVVGEVQMKAAESIESLGYKVKTIGRVSSERPGTVLAEFPSAGTTARPKRTVVKLTVAIPTAG